VFLNERERHHATFPPRKALKVGELQNFSFYIAVVTKHMKQFSRFKNPIIIRKKLNLS